MNKAKWIPLITMLSMIGYSASASSPYAIEALIYHDDFDADLNSWVVEQTPDGVTEIRDGRLHIDGGGATVWFSPVLQGPIMIEYEAELIQQGGPNDNCRDLNCFWMARHPKAPHDLFEGWRSNSEIRGGVFSNYHDLRTYYVGNGGKKNTTSRFRRYTGFGARPLLPEHDLTASGHRLRPNHVYKIQVVACNELIQWIRDGEVMFELNDPKPYKSGWFGFRTVDNHMALDGFRVYRLRPTNSRMGYSGASPEQFDNAERLGLGHGLTELTTRRGWRDMGLALRGDKYLSERVVFHDLETGGLAWRMTSDPAIENNEYYDLPAWSANGEHMLFESRREGDNHRWFMNADGSGLHPCPPELEGNGYVSVRYPDVFYAVSKEENADGEVIATRVTQVDMETGQGELLFSIDKDLGQMQPPHPDEELFLFGQRFGAGRDDPEVASVVYVVHRDGSYQAINLERRWHRLRFTTAPSGRVFFNFDDPRRSFTVMPDGTDRIELPFEGGHPDWLPGGEWLFFNAREVLPDGRKIFDVRYDAIRWNGKDLRTLFPYGGHASATSDGRYLIPDGGPGSGMISWVKTDGTRTSNTVLMARTSRYDHSNRWHPQHHSTHPHPSNSPDGTKALSNSDAVAEFTDIYVSVGRFPDPPLALSASRQGDRVRLDWNLPERHQEIQGYHVYRTRDSGLGYEPLTREPVPATHWEGPVLDGDAYYVVTAAEYSGLQSMPSNEVYQAGNEAWQGPIRLLLEAEAGQYRLPFEANMDMQGASGGFYLRSRDGEGGGICTFEINLPQTSIYSLWGRVRGPMNDAWKSALQVEVDGEDWGSLAGAPDAWSWVKLSPSKNLRKGHHLLKITSEAGEHQFDKILLTNDLTFMPRGMMSHDIVPPEPPAGLTVEALSPNAARLVWQSAQALDIAYYNVYGSSNPDFSCTQAHRIGSPVAAEWVDWGLPLNQAYYYRLTSVDRAGNESSPGPIGSLSLPRFNPVRIELDPAMAKVDGLTPVQVAMLGRMALSGPEHATGRARWSFEVPRDGHYAIWVKTTHEQGNQSGVDLVIDGEHEIPVRPGGIWGTWFWSPAGQKSAGSPEIFMLEAGHHEIEARLSGPQSRLTRLVITDDPSWWPVHEMKSTGY